MPTAMNHFELLGVEPSASLDEIKQGYRQQMARYHPDKLQHLGQEFVDLAVRRATDLSEAYDVACRQLEHPEQQSADRGANAPVDRVVPGDAEGGAPPGGSTDPAFEDGFLRSAAISVFAEAVEGVLGEVEIRRVAGFDPAFASEPRRGFFKSSVPPFLLLARLVPTVDASAVEAAWRAAARLPGDPERIRSLFVMGQHLGPASELADAISAERRRPIRSGAGILLVPVNLRTWESLVPADAPDAIKAIIERLRTR